MRDFQRGFKTILYARRLPGQMGGLSGNSLFLALFPSAPIASIQRMLTNAVQEAMFVFQARYQRTIKVFLCQDR